MRFFLYLLDVLIESVYCILDRVYAFGDIFSCEVLASARLCCRTRLLVVFVFVSLLEG